MKFTEAQVEAAILDLLVQEGYPHVLGKAIDRQPQEAVESRLLRTLVET